MTTKIRQYIAYSLLFSSTFLFSCDSDDEENPQPTLTTQEQLLVAQPWVAEGIYLNGVRQANTPSLRLTFSANLAGIIKTVSVSGIPTPSTWQLNSNATQLTITYPSGTQFGGLSQIVLNLSRLTANNLDFTSNQEGSLFGVIVLNAETEVRMIPQP